MALLFLVGVLPFFFNELPKCALTQLTLLFLVVIGFHGVLGQSLGLITHTASEQGNVIGLVSVYNIYSAFSFEMPLTYFSHKTIYIRS